MTTVERAGLNAVLTAYLRSGGIPDALKYTELPILRTLYDDVLHRDIATRYRVDAVTSLKELAFTLISNPSGKVTYSRLKEQLKLGSVNTITSYIDYLQDSWLLFAITLYDFSVKRQQIAPKKIYCIDTGLANTVGFNFSPNTGKLLENAVYLALRQRTKEIYYYTTPGDYEVDFYLPDQQTLIQVSQHLSNAVTREREMRALADALKVLKAKQAIILTDANESDGSINGVPLQIVSAAEWLLADAPV
jgi:hypothetical protein